MKTITLILLCLIGSFYLKAQDTSAAVAKAPAKSKLSVKKADALFEKQQYREALNEYYVAYQNDPKNVNLNYKVGLCYHYLMVKPSTCEQLFGNALISTTDKYDFYSDKQISASVDAFYFMGKSFLYENKVDSAVNYFVSYQEQVHNGAQWLDVARQMKMCMNNKQAGKLPRPVNIIPFKSNINSGYQEGNPVLSIDNQTMFFSSSKPDVKKKETLLSDKDIYISQSTGNNTWSDPVPFNYNTENDDEPLYLSTDGKKLYVRVNGDIAVSEKGDGGWGSPVKLTVINSSSDENGVGVSADGMTIIVSSNRPGGNGGYDLYISKNKNGKWSSPKNMGPAVNTDMDEIYPFVHPTDGRIYFSSNGNTNYGVGGFDVLYTLADSAGKWNDVHSAGYPINKGGNELSYYATSEGRSFYSALNADGDFDIFEIVAGAYDATADQVVAEETLESLPTTKEVSTVQLLEVEKEKIVEKEKEMEVVKTEMVETEVEKSVGQIDIADIGKVDKLVAIREKEVMVEAAPVDVERENAKETDKANEKMRSGGAAQTIVEDDPNNTIYHTVKAGETITTISKKNNTTPDKIKKWNNLPDDNIPVGKELIVAYKEEPSADQIALKKLEKAGISKEERESIIVGIKNYYYEKLNRDNNALFKTYYFDFNTLKPDLSKNELDILVTFMTENPKVNIEVIGHTDDQGKWKTNFWISRERAKNIYDYLLAKNISGNRIIFNGKGSTMPIADNSTKEGRAKNRRVEIMFIK